MAHHAYAKNAKIGPEGLLSEKDKERKSGNRRGKKTNRESGARRRIFGVWWHSTGSVLSDCPMHHAGGTLLQ